MRIITGMHRSGTSFLAQAFARMGADFGPADLMFPADVWNQNGYFESIQAVDINNQLILGAGTPIDLWLKAPEHGLDRIVNSVKSRKWKYFLKPSRAKIHARVPAFERQIKALHDTYANLYVKDPRFCLTLGVWTDLGPVDDVVFSYRNPYAVAASVKRREKLPLGLGYQQWLYHVQGFWSQVDPSTPVFLVDFDQFFVAETQAAAFGRLIGYTRLNDVETHTQALIAELDPRLRHHDQIDPHMPKPVAAAYAALQHLYGICGPDGIMLKDHPDLAIDLTGAKP